MAADQLLLRVIDLRPPVLRMMRAVELEGEERHVLLVCDYEIEMRPERIAVMAVVQTAALDIQHVGDTDLRIDAHAVPLSSVAKDAAYDAFVEID